MPLSAAISKFAKVQLFKPKTAHATRSSFYLVAKDVDTKSPYAVAAMMEWKSEWFAATFGGLEGAGEKAKEPTDTYVMEILRMFGPEIIEMGTPIWKIQADALATSPYAGDDEGSTEAKGGNADGLSLERK